MSFSRNRIENRCEMVKIGAAAGQQIVDGNHAPTLAEQGIAEMGSEETGCRR